MWWGPASCALAPRVLYARSCFGVPLWAGRLWLPAHSLAAVCERLRIRLPEPIGYATERVSPAYYVELRALDIAREEQRLATPHVCPRPHIHVLKLLWPFRWPTPAASSASPVPVAAPVQGAQSSMNLLI
jgi:hypothetical protein